MTYKTFDETFDAVAAGTMTAAAAAAEIVAAYPKMDLAHSYSPDTAQRGDACRAVLVEWQKLWTDPYAAPKEQDLSALYRGIERRQDGE